MLLWQWNKLWQILALKNLISQTRALASSQAQAAPLLRICYKPSIQQEKKAQNVLALTWCRAACHQQWQPVSRHSLKSKA